MSTITSANLTNAIVKLVAADALPALMGNLVMGNLVNRDYEPVLAHAGDTVNVPIPPTLVANNLAEGGTVTPQTPSLGNAQIVLNTHAEATFQIPDVTKALAFPELLKAYMQPAVIAIAERVETDLLNLYSSFSANTPVGTAGAPVTEATIDAAETALFSAMVPASAPKYLVVNSNTYSQIRQIPRFSEYYSSGDAGLRALVEGNVGKMKDFFIFRSQFVPTTGGSSPNAHNLAFSRDAIGPVDRRLPQPRPGTGAIAE
ncbi:MAG TPA: P22 phage major capsid protein family protein, partial [Bryobacteraceae bacterium]